MNELKHIDIEKIVPNNYNPNIMTEEEYSSLKEGIKITNGKYLEDNPILVRPLENGIFEIIDGEHRWKAAKELKFKELPCKVKTCSREEAQVLNVILDKDRGNIDYLKLSKIFYEQWKGIKESSKEPKYDWQQERLIKMLDAPGNKTLKKIGTTFGYNKKTVVDILRIEIRLPEELKQKSDISDFFSNFEKVMLARVVHPKLQLGLISNSFNEKGKRIWNSKKLSRMTTLYNEAWKKIESSLENINDQNEAIDNIIKSKAEHMNDIQKIIDSIKAKLLGPEFSDEELGLKDFKCEITTRWDIGKRATWGTHKKFGEFKYHGNYPPQIARNFIWRYSNPNKGELVLDPMCGSGTTLVEAKILGQRSIGIDISEEAIEIAKKMIRFIVKDRVSYEPQLRVADARKLNELKDKDGKQLLPAESVDLIATHPPYWDMVKWSKKGLENETFEGFLVGMKSVFEQMYYVLKPKRFCCIMIGDVYRKSGKIVTLIDEFLRLGKQVGFEVFDLAVKFSEGQESMMGGVMKWRAEEYNFLIPSHDFILIFRKP